MKKLKLFLLGLLVQTGGLAANPSFYVVDIRADNNAMLHNTQEKADRAQKLPLTIIERNRSTCCFVFGAQTKTALKINDDQPSLSSSRGEAIFQFPGAYRPAAAEKSDNKLGFGLTGMSGAKLVGNRTYEVRFADNTPPVFVRHCLGTEGVNFKLYHSLEDKKPYIKYYYALGYDVEADCPAKP